MDKSEISVIKERLNTTAKALRNNNMAAYVVDSKADALSLVASLLKDGCTVSTGGSMSLKDCGIYELLKSGRYNYLDRNAEGLSPEQVKEIYIKTFGADAYLCSSNAVTENGELYNVDGNSNRVAAICYGPETVIMVVGYNKVVKNFDEAVNRVKTIAAPANCERLGVNSYCRAKGKCKAFISENPELPSGCTSDTRICCNYVVSARQRHKDRIKVILVCEKLGY